MHIRYILSLIAVAVIGAVLFFIEPGDDSLAGQNASPEAGGQVFIEQLPPSSKDAIHALLESADVPLSNHESCSGVGTDLSDQTIGEYISGFLAELDDAQATNTIEASVQKTQPEKGQDGWAVRVMIGQSKGEVVWRWGVEYHVREKDGLVVPSSFRCLGGG